MKSNPIVWLEIYVQDMERTKQFYEAVFQMQLEKLEAPDIEMWVFPIEMDDYINEHLAADLSLADLAGTVALSSFHFARLFKESTGCAPHQYHIRCRVKRSKELLLEKELSIAHIAQAVGFASQSHLNYHFKRVVGITPMAFLRQ